MIFTDTDWPVSSLEFSSDTRPRFPGLHISQISRGLAETRGVDKNKSGMTPEQVDEYAAVGFMWEEMFARELARWLSAQPIVIQPPVVAFDGERARLLDPDPAPGGFVPSCDGWVIGTPDFLELDDDLGIVLTDTKATYKSMSGAASPESWMLKNRWDWLINLQFYALALRRAGIDVERIRYRLLFLAGDYKFVRPVRRVWTSGILNENELMDNWSMCWQFAKEKGWL